ncbi:16S rRNA (guanine(527)-N(7))-methyltransferase RsmG [Phaeovulum sp. NW3]|uniref:16S rRNA (guanine(527)-N(7))-methyltransferase RsmG n=1 Tax=Phaeovulum sp. NW3 TaxID=2934933 RepID=UPI002020633A|nr:16S rRNA (guanine(527)-N(7))-methyltransferase RsmG [Phaeovulum sp. NW3]MCL7465490.1 16S rRNA (guanine(527)-N(7))-methyltransferase RsmG [Phaeovulum sp. NW3]
MVNASVRTFQERFDVSRETLDRLSRYEVLLQKWNPAINLVSNGTLQDIWARHFLDSAQLFSIAAPSEGRWVDLGSGGGFPGLVIAILALEKAPGIQMTLVESDLRKSAFLSTVAREIGLRVLVLSERIERLEPMDADVLSARALAPLPRLLDFAQLHLKSSGTALFPKGATWRDEVALARTRWVFNVDSIPSLTDPASVVLKIQGVSRA